MVLKLRFFQLNIQKKGNVKFLIGSNSYHSKNKTTKNLCALFFLIKTII